jgi:hypothetical protein
MKIGPFRLLTAPSLPMPFLYMNFCDSARRAPGEVEVLSGWLEASCSHVLSTLPGRPRRQGPRGIHARLNCIKILSWAEPEAAVVGALLKASTPPACRHSI